MQKKQNKTKKVLSIEYVHQVHRAIAFKCRTYFVKELGS